MVEEQIPPLKKKLPIKTKVAAWMLLIIAIIAVIVSIGISIAASCSHHEDISNYAAFPFLMGFGIAFVFYFLPGVLLMFSRRWGPWILSFVILYLGILISTGFMLWYSTAFVCILISLSIPLILILLDKLSCRFVILTTVALAVISLGCFFGVSYGLGYHRNQAKSFETRMTTELYDLYGKAIENRDEKGCQGCEEVNQYFNEQWNQLDPDVKAASCYDSTNGQMYNICLKAIAFMTQNDSCCGADSGQCHNAVQALIANDVSACSGQYSCIMVFSMVTDNPSLCEQCPLAVQKDRCHDIHNMSEENPDDYFGLYWYFWYGSALNLPDR